MSSDQTTQAPQAKLDNSLVCPLQLLTMRNKDDVLKALADQAAKLGIELAKDEKGIVIKRSDVTKVQTVTDTAGKAYEVWAYNRSDPGIEYYLVPAGFRTGEADGFIIVGAHGRTYKVEKGAIYNVVIPKAKPATATAPSGAPKEDSGNGKGSVATPVNQTKKPDLTKQLK